MGVIAPDPNPFTTMSMDLKLDKELSHIAVRIKAMGPHLEVTKWDTSKTLRACLVRGKKCSFLYSFLVFCGTYYKKLVWFASLYSVFIFNILKK